MKIQYCSVACSLTFLFSAGIAPAQTHETSFEGLLGETDFFIGPARFTGGVAQTIGIPAFYSDGLFAWDIDGQATGLVDFGPGASTVDFQARGSASGDLVITPLDAAGGNPIGSAVTVSGPSFMAVNFTSQALGRPITHLAFENMGIAGDIAAVDEFAFTVIPEPASWALSLVGMICAAIMLLLRPQSSYATAQIARFRRH